MRQNYTRLSLHFGAFHLKPCDQCKKYSSCKTKGRVRPSGESVELLQAILKHSQFLFQISSVLEGGVILRAKIVDPVIVQIPHNLGAEPGKYGVLAVALCTYGDFVVTVMGQPDAGGVEGLGAGSMAVANTYTSGSFWMRHVSTALTLTSSTNFLSAT